MRAAHPPGGLTAAPELIDRVGARRGLEFYLEGFHHARGQPVEARGERQLNELPRRQMGGERLKGRV